MDHPVYLRLYVAARERPVQFGAGKDSGVDAHQGHRGDE